MPVVCGAKAVNLSPNNDSGVGTLTNKGPLPSSTKKSFFKRTSIVFA